MRQARVELPGGGLAAVVRVHYFTSGARRDVQQALLDGEIDGVDGYVLDLRNNPGAVPHPAPRRSGQLSSIDSRTCFRCVTPPGASGADFL